MIDSVSRICRSSTHGAKTTDTDLPLSYFPLRVCVNCFTDTATNLQKIPSMYRDLAHRLGTSGQHVSFIRKTGRRPGGGTVLDESAVEARAAVRDVLISWSTLVADERHLSVRSLGDLEVSSLARFLIIHLSWLAAHRAAVEFVDEIRELMAATGTEECGLSNIDSYSCIVPGCMAQLSAHTRGTVRATVSEIRCARGHAWSVEEWLLLRRGIRDHSASAALANLKVSTRVAALALGVPEATIRQWARRGKLTRHGTPCRAEYDLEELTKLAEQRSG